MLWLCAVAYLASGFGNRVGYNTDTSARDDINSNIGINSNSTTTTAVRYEWTVFRQLRNVAAVSAAFNPLTNATELLAMVQAGQRPRAQGYAADDYYRSQRQASPPATIYRLQQDDQQPVSSGSKFVEVVPRQSMHPAASFGPPESPDAGLAVGPFETWGVARGQLLRCLNPCNGEWHRQPFHPSPAEDGNGQRPESYRSEGYRPESYRSESYRSEGYRSEGYRQQQYAGQSQISQVALSAKHALVLANNRRQLYKMSLCSLDQTRTGRNWELVEGDRELSSACIAPDGSVFAVAAQDGLLRRFNATGWTKVPIQEDSMVLQRVAAGQQRLFVTDRSGLLYTAPVNASRAGEWTRVGGIRGVKGLSSVELDGRDAVVAVDAEGRVCLGRIKA